MGFMEKLGATIATKYGSVTEGKHKDCLVALGNPPDQKVTTSNKFTQIIFLENKETMGRYDIGIEAKALRILANDADSCTVAIDFADGESCTIVLTTPKEDNAAVSLLKKNFGLKSATKVNANGTTETDNSVKYHNIKTFLLTFIDNYANDDEMMKVHAYLKGLGLLK